MDEPGQVFDDQAFEADLKKQTAYWQKLLALQDWNVEVRVSRQWEMDSPSTLAQVSWFLHRKDAIIRVLHPTDLPGLQSKFLNGEENDYDISLVHELLHLHFAPLETGEDYFETASEQAINAISRGFVKLYRTQPESPKLEPIMHPANQHGYI